MIFRPENDMNRKVGRLLDLGAVLLALLILGICGRSLTWLLHGLKDWLPAALLPFLIAAATAVLLEPIVSFFELRCHMRRLPAVLLGLFLSLLLAGVVLTVICSRVAAQVMELSRMIAGQSALQSSAFLQWWNHLLIHINGTGASPQLMEKLEQLVQQDADTLKMLLRTTAEFLTNTLMLLPQSLMFLAVVGMASFFMLKDRYVIRTFLLGLLPMRCRTGVRFGIGRVLMTFLRFVRAYSLLIGCTMLLTMFGLWLLRIPFAFSAGVFAGLLDILPVAGPGLLFLPWGIWAFLQGKSSMGFSVLMVYITIALVRHILEPKIVGGSVGLHPLVSLIALYVGLKMAGLWGMILLPMLLALTVTFCRMGVFHSSGWEDGDE